MARNQEKAQAMLNRFLADKAGGGKPATKKRPHLASECSDLNEADRWRLQVLREIGRKVMEIQNAALGEHRIRDLNDEINKLIREKGHWERRIVELGGPDYAKAAPKVTADDGDDAAAAAAATTAGGGGAGGYRYFGAAKQLPGVKEMFEKPAPRAASRRTRAQLAKNLTPDYFGFRDEDDGALLRLERAAERGTYSEARMREWEAACGGGGGAGEEGGQAKRGRRDEEQAAAGRRGGAAGAATGAGDDGFAAFVPLPDRAAIESLVVAKKKRDLLARYASEASLQQQAEAAALANPSAAKPPPR